VETVLIIIFILFGLGLVAYFFLMMFYPEWVGITGSDTKKELEEESKRLDEKDKLDSSSPQK
jgi:hypothetical protein